MDSVWSEAVEVESLTVLVIVDNATDMLSPPCDCCRSKPPTCKYSNEVIRGVADVRAGKAACFDFSTSLLAGHGLSLLLTAQPTGGGRQRTLLFDAGPQRQLWRTNAERLGISAADIEAVVLSHWHMDHSGALPEVAAMIAEARGAAASAASTCIDAGAEPPPTVSPLPAVFDVHPRRPHLRGMMGLDGKPVPWNPDPELRELEVAGATVVQKHSEAHTLCDGCFYVSGAIPRVTSYEQGNPTNASQFEEGGPWELDPLLMDERYVAVRVRGKGAVVFSACSHAGVINVMLAAKEVAGGRAPYGVVGGFHLATADCLDRIPPTVADMAALSPAVVVAGHCTGWRAQAALQAALPGRCMPCSVGSSYEFSAPAAG